MLSRTKRHCRWAFYSTLVGLLAGISATVFLYLLEFATRTRIANPALIWALPMAGFGIGWLYHRYGKNVAAGTNLILDEIHNPKKVVPFYMAPLILVGTVLTHLVGGSAGREGTAVQMGASLADQLTPIFKIEPEERKTLLVAGMGAGFSAAIGVPLAGILFGMEVLYVGRLRLFAVLECVIASFIGFYTTVLLRAPHSHFPKIPIPFPSLKILFYVAVAGIAFGLAARVFIGLTHAVEKVFAKTVVYPPFKTLIGGLLLAIFFYLEASYHYAGLGISIIQEALQVPAALKVPVFKAIATALTIGSGFKGGEFIPLVFIGATLGSALSIILPISFQLLAALGFAAVFGAAANTPIACTIMACEIFGFRILPYAVLACFIGRYASGPHGIYRSQLQHKGN